MSHFLQKGQKFSNKSFNCCMFCCTLFYAHTNFAIILMGKRELVALLGIFLFLVSLDGCVALPNGVMGLSTVFDCGIS